MTKNSEHWLYHTGIRMGRKEVAENTLNALRACRDNCPDDYDKMMSSDMGRVMVALWDLLKEYEKQ